MLLHNPGNAHHAYRRELDKIEWDGDDEHFDAWREGRTGYPVVDAGMRQLAATGWMHNRARLITACFLVKDLHIDWRRGEQHFMRCLLDGDEANNNGNWQWISSVGVDPAPLHRRLYNPVLQQERHDPKGDYVRRWVPELRDVPDKYLAKPWALSDGEREAVGADAYPAPIVDHAVERERTLAAYRAARATRKLRPTMARFEIEPRGPFTLASAARFINGWPPGKAHADRRRGPPALPRRRLERPGHRRPARRTATRSTARSRPTTSRARSSRPRGSSRSTTTAAATRTSASATRSSASCNATAATCAPCSSTRPTRPPPGRSSRPAPSTPRP